MATEVAVYFITINFLLRKTFNNHSQQRWGSIRHNQIFEIPLVYPKGMGEWKISNCVGSQSFGKEDGNLAMSA